MNICIDARFWGVKYTGLGVYTKNLVINLLECDSKNNYTLLVRKNFDGRQVAPSVKTIVVDIDAYTFKEQFLLPFILYKHKFDVVHFPSINIPIFYFKKYIVTIHDVIKHESKGVMTTTRHPLLYWFKYGVYKVVFWWITHFSKKIIVPSFTVKKVLESLYKETKDKIIVTYEASNVTNDIKIANNIPSLPDRFAVYTGNAYPHKNLDRLITIWKTIFKRTNTHLLLIGSRSIFAKRLLTTITTEKTGDCVHYMGFLSEDQLVGIYRKAQIYIFPSFTEGFGLPGLDAMMCKLPLVCSDIATFKEIYGQGAYYFDPKDSSDMISKITDVLTQKSLRVTLINAGSKQVKKYSWKQMAEKTYNAYESCNSI